MLQASPFSSFYLLVTTRNAKVKVAVACPSSTTLLLLLLVATMIVTTASSGRFSHVAGLLFSTRQRVTPNHRVVPFCTFTSTRRSHPFQYECNNSHCPFVRQTTTTTTRPCSLFHTTTIRTTTRILMSAMEDVDETAAATTTTTVDLDNKNDNSSRTWDVGGLRKEISRLTVRCHKKIGKTNQRLQNAQQEINRLTGTEDVTMEELEACPNLEEIIMELEDLQNRLKQLNKLEVLLQDIKGKIVILPNHISQLAVDLDLDDAPPKQSERGVKKEKGPKNMNSFRLPYRRYYTKNKTEIRVGKQANDNDDLSLSPEHRDSSDWWMHASGCPGSHVVIRCHDQNLDEEVVMDAAALAARQSKCNGNVIKVSMTRARDVKKPPGAKAGLVQLTGQVRTVIVNMKEAETRLERLDKTVLIN